MNNPSKTTRSDRNRQMIAGGQEASRQYPVDRRRRHVVHAGRYRGSPANLNRFVRRYDRRHGGVPQGGRRRKSGARQGGLRVPGAEGSPLPSVHGNARHARRLRCLAAPAADPERGDRGGSGRQARGHPRRSAHDGQAPEIGNQGASPRDLPDDGAVAHPDHVGEGVIAGTATPRLSKGSRGDLNSTAPACSMARRSEAWMGFEPTYDGFANRCLTTWLPRHFRNSFAAYHLYRCLPWGSLRRFWVRLRGLRGRGR
jgi:hypothetical protein